MPAAGGKAMAQDRKVDPILAQGRQSVQDQARQGLDTTFGEHLLTIG